ncbi:TlpA family protein disulfide reductase [bacterium]|nr:TlpA family protein disulfide reductase [bacterium]
MKLLSSALFILSVSFYPANAQKDTLLEIGSPSPNFFLKHLDGSEFFSRDYYGDTRNLPKGRKERNNVVISFFATWCIPCKKEIPELEILAAKYTDVKFYLINVAEDKEKIKKYLNENPIRLPILLDIYGKVSEKFNVKDGGNALAVLPTLVMINKEGTIHFYKKGYVEGDEKKIEGEILKMLETTQQ